MISLSFRIPDGAASSFRADAELQPPAADALPRLRRAADCFRCFRQSFRQLMYFLREAAAAFAKAVTFLRLAAFDTPPEPLR